MTIPPSSTYAGNFSQGLPNGSVEGVDGDSAMDRSNDIYNST